MSLHLFKKIHYSLPIFEIPWGERFIMYTPGRISVFNKDEKENFYWLLTETNNSQPLFTDHKTSELIQSALDAQTSWDILQKCDFDPECLTVYPGYECNLHCRYCYSRMVEKDENKIIIGFDAVVLAARKVASSCLMKKKPFVFVAHGGGEPTFHWDLLTKITEKVKQVAGETGSGFFGYIATNGNLEPEKVKWLARNFNLIGLSCDGPPEQNQSQRNGSLNRILEQTAKIILEEGGKFDVRATITKKQIYKQPDIAEYIIDRLEAKTIRFEPEYLNMSDPFTEEDARPFAENFLKASDLAESKGSKLNYSGVRINEIHSSFCDINRQTMRINPYNQIINCFCDVDKRRYQFGTVNLSENRIEYADYEDLKKGPFELKKECGNCINIYHCARGCPDHCVHINEPLNRFRCTLNTLLTVEMIKKEASRRYEPS